MESFQKRARERRKREKQAEKQARRHDRSAVDQTDAREGTPGDPSIRPLPPALLSNDGAPAESPSTTRPST
jgi:hypothetical protein